MADIEIGVSAGLVPPRLRLLIAGIYREAAGSWRAIGDHDRAHALDVKAAALEFESDRVIRWFEEEGPS